MGIPQHSSSQITTSSQHFWTKPYSVGATQLSMNVWTQYERKYREGLAAVRVAVDCHGDRNNSWSRFQRRTWDAGRDLQGREPFSLHTFGLWDLLGGGHPSSREDISVVHYAVSFLHLTLETLSDNLPLGLWQPGPPLCVAWCMCPEGSSRSDRWKLEVPCGICPLLFWAPGEKEP